MKVSRIGLVVIALLILASAALGQKVTTNSAPNVNWSKYHTYAWGEGTAPNDPLIAQQIVAAIDSQLAAKGLKKVDKDADLVVIYHTTTEEQKSLNWSSFGGWGRFGGGMGSAQVDTVVNGQLIIDMADAQAKQFIWRGTAADTVSSNPQKLMAKIDKALAKMFQKFPS